MADDMCNPNPQPTNTMFDLSKATKFNKADSQKRLNTLNTRRVGRRGSDYDVFVKKGQELEVGESYTYGPVSKGQVSSIRARFYDHNGGKFESEDGLGIWLVSSEKRADSPPSPDETYDISVFKLGTEPTVRESKKKKSKAEKKVDEKQNGQLVEA